MTKRAKTSRKGKKQWRANISTAETDEFLAKQALEDRSGGPVESLPSDSLFFVDKSKDTTIEKKTKKHQSKTLHFESILQRNSLISPLRAALKSKHKRKDRDVAKPPRKDKPVPMPVANLDNTEVVKGVSDAWEDQGDKIDSTELGTSNSKTRSKKHPASKRARVEAPAVEVDAAGCSYNPTFNDHQEALGLAVAHEMEKVFKKELEPRGVPRSVAGLPIDEEEAFFLDVDTGEGDDEDDEEGSSGNADGQSSGSRAVKLKKLTRAELNRKERRRQNSRVESQKKKLLKLKKDILRLPEIEEDIAAEIQEKEKRYARKTISREERRAQEPPRLGKYKFTPEPVQVLLTEEVTGSLRQIKGCYTLARERFKSFQRRGILEPRVKVSKKERRKGVLYEQGSRGAKEREMHAAREAERAARKQSLAVIPL